MKERITNWIELHKKGVLVAMILVLLIGLITLITRPFTHKNNRGEEAFKKLKEKSQKTSSRLKSGYRNMEDVQELYLKAKKMMEKDSLTKEDYEYLRSADSTLKSLILIQ
jgi:uncharacterized membrane protein (DUF106 family)